MKNEIPQKCGICGSSNITTRKDVGFDIDPSGEERQHLDICADCGAKRFNIDRIENFVAPAVKYFTPWEPASKSPSFFDELI